MSSESRKQLFISYAQADAEPVVRIIEALRHEYRERALPIEVWIDRDALRPGEQWNHSIQRALLDSFGLLIFVSPASMSSKWVQAEIAAVATATDRFIVPVILEHVTDLPLTLAQRQWLDLSDRLTPRAIRSAVAKIVDATVLYLKRDHITSLVPQAEAPKLAECLAREVRGTESGDKEAGSTPDSVFVVHGHDEATLLLVCAFLNELEIKPVVLSHRLGPAQSLLQKFFKTSKEAHFAIVILTADDFGASRIQYEADGVADKSLQFRTRQNVILELGFFYGYLGWENVFVVYQKPPKVFPNFERPSDLDGAVFDEIDEAGQWRETLTGRLAEAGFKLGGRLIDGSFNR